MSCARPSATSLLGADPEVTLSQRAKETLPRLRADRGDEVSKDGLVLRRRPAGGSRFWTWAGLRANATLLAGLGLDVAEPRTRACCSRKVSGRPRSGQPTSVQYRELDAEAITALKFAAALPPELAARTLGERLADPDGAASVVQTPLVRMEVHPKSGD